MSYKVSVYFNDENIASTQIRSGSFINVTKYYGDDAYIAAGFTNSTTFTATPADGCHFTKWYYRIGGDSGAIQDSEDNPFYYSGTEDIIIRAEGEADDIEEPIYWGVYGESKIDVGDYSETIEGQLSEYMVIRYPLVFSSSGIIGVSLWCNENTIMYLSKDYDVDYATGIPMTHEAISYNGYIQYNQVYDDETYYLFVRGLNGTETSSFDIDITPPWGRGYGNLGLIPETGITKDCRLLKRELARFQCGFAKSGMLTISFTSNNPAMCWVGTHADEGVDRPLITDAYGELYNISIPYSVEQGVTYYIWIRPYYNTDYINGTLKISYDGESSIKKWSWSASNGSNASASVTLNSYYALNKDEPTSDFSHLVWMDMVDKVWDIIKATTTNGWDEDYASLYDTKNLPQNSDGLYELTAVAFNSLRNNIELVGLKLGMSKIPNATDGDNAVSGTIPHPVTSGRKVFAHYFLTLADYINDCIDNL